MPFDAKGAEHAGGGVMGMVTKKVGPLPLWSYVVIGGVLVFILRKRGGSASASGGRGISIPTLQPGGAADGSIGQGGNAVGSPGQNAQGGSDTQPGGAAPWWNPGTGDFAPGARSTLPGPDTIGPGGTTVRNSPGGNPGGATTGPNLFSDVGKTAGVLGAQPAGGWTAPPVFQDLSPTNVLDTSGGKTSGGVNPGNRLLGYSNPLTGALEPSPNGGPAIWA